MEKFTYSRQLLNKKLSFTPVCGNVTVVTAKRRVLTHVTNWSLWHLPEFRLLRGVPRLDFGSVHQWHCTTLELGKWHERQIQFRKRSSPPLLIPQGDKLRASWYRSRKRRKNSCTTWLIALAWNYKRCCYYTSTLCQSSDSIKSPYFLLPGQPPIPKNIGLATGGKLGVLYFNIIHWPTICFF